MTSPTSQTSGPLPTPCKVQSSLSLRSMTQIPEITDEYLCFPQLPVPIVLDDFKSPCFQKRSQSPYFSYPSLACAFKSPGYTQGRLKHELWVVVDEKTRAFVKTSKNLTNPLPRYYVRYLVLFPAKSTCQRVLFRLNTCMTKTMGSGDFFNTGTEFLAIQ